MPHTRAEVAGIHWYRYFEWLHFRLPALALNIPPRIALDGWLVDVIWVTLTNSA